VGIEKLIAALEKEAILKEEAILAEAERNAEETLKDAERKQREIEKEIETLSAVLGEKKKLLEEGRRRMNERRKEAVLENLCVEALKAECRKLFREFMRTDGYRKFLQAELKKVEAELGKMDGIRADGVTAGILAGIAEAAVSADNSVEDGFVAEAGKGAVTVYSTFDSRLEKIWEETAPEFIKEISELLKNAG
jgi:vacuolar-type H+-ATPase subunit E/Vma4